MDVMGLLTGLLLGLLAGAAIAHLWARGRHAEALNRLALEQEQECGTSAAQLAAKNAELQQFIDRSRTEREDLSARIRAKEDELREAGDGLVRLSGQLATEQERARGLLAKLNEQKIELEQLQGRMTKEFELIANKLLTERGKELNAQQQEKLGDILKPLNERIGEFQKQVREAYENEGKERHLLKSEVARLVEQNQRLSKEADNLTRALKGDSQAQGAWGEMILEKLLGDSGLVKGQEYSMQASTTMGDGSRLRPDAVVMLPEGKHLVIDSKVSLLHYERFATTADEAEKDRLLKQHVESLRAHAKGLSEKDYTKLYAVDSVDFVLMFVPIEPAFLLALRERPEIFQEAYDRQVVMVTHSTLMATLRTVHGIWKNERITRNHLAIAERAGALYEKFVGFTEDLGRIGKNVKEANENYEKALGKLSEGPGNLVRQVEMLKQLGAKANKTLHPKLLERALEEQNAGE